MISLISTWTIVEGKNQEAITALAELAHKVQAHEPQTLVYIPYSIDTQKGSYNLPNPEFSNAPPLPNPNNIVFVEIYANKAALDLHLNGPNGPKNPSGTYVDFISKHGHLFVSIKSASGPRMAVQQLTYIGGFVREEADLCI